jgi:hypothetical protein
LPTSRKVGKWQLEKQRLAAKYREKGQKTYKIILELLCISSPLMVITSMTADNH